MRQFLPRRSWLRPWPFVLIVLATLAGAIGALSVYRSDHDLSTGTVRLGVDPGHQGALDIYVPLVDWGARFDAVRLPARLRIEARTIESQAIRRVASGGVNVERLRLEARDAIETYIRRLVLLVAKKGISVIADMDAFYQIYDESKLIKYETSIQPKTDAKYSSLLCSYQRTNFDRLTKSTRELILAQHYRKIDATL